MVKTFPLQVKPNNNTIPINKRMNHSQRFVTHSSLKIFKKISHLK